MTDRLELDFVFAEPDVRSLQVRPSAERMRILVLGDFSGRDSRGRLESGTALADRPIVPVDVDSFDSLLFRFAPGLDLPLTRGTEERVEVEIKELDDFHPDALYRKLDVFEALRGMRRRMLDPATFEAEAEALRRLGGEPGRPDAVETVEDDSSTLQRLLGRGPTGAPRGSGSGRAPVDIDAFIARIVAPHIVPGVTPQQDGLVRSVDEATGVQMRRLLHHPRFQALESAWRALHWLVSGLETGETLHVSVLDVTKNELAADLCDAGGEPGRSGLYRAIAEPARAPDGEGWSLVVGSYRFGALAEDASLLASLGSLASHAGGPFMAEADGSLLGCGPIHTEPDPASWSPTPDADRVWRALRGSASAQWIGLALPRFLLRLPYGRRTDEVSDFEFEELPQDRPHASYLWGNPAMACAMLIARAFLESGWAMEPGDFLDIEDLPAHTYAGDDGPVLMPCAEVALGERAAQAILGRGIMPLVSYRNRNAARLMRFQSVADPPAPLSGPWR